jgi:hypothetical protein
MAPDLRDEARLVFGAGLEPAFAVDDSLHDASSATLGKRA